jgi:hypothetical protein
MEQIMKHLPYYAVSLVTLACVATNSALAQVKAPPLPRGSEKVKLHPGQNPKEMRRDKNAHQRPIRDKKLDDRLTPAVLPAITAANTK